MTIVIKSWTEIRQAVLAKEPRAGAALDVLEKYWGDGSLTLAVAERFITAYLCGDYVAARREIYKTASAEALVDADRAENAVLATQIAQEKKLYDFAAELGAIFLKVALGAALAAVGF